MSKPHIGGRPPRYLFYLNPYRNVRFTHCPRCQRLTNLRKFAFLIHIDELGLVALGKTSRFCPRCELIIVHQDEIEPEVANITSRPLSKRLSTQYVVLGTIPVPVWKSALRNRLSVETVRQLASDFKHHLRYSTSSES
jgi:hypothetical protein